MTAFFISVFSFHHFVWLLAVQILPENQFHTEGDELIEEFHPCFVPLFARKFSGSADHHAEYFGRPEKDFAEGVGIILALCLRSGLPDRFCDQFPLHYEKAALGDTPCSCKVNFLVPLIPEAVILTDLCCPAIP